MNGNSFLARKPSCPNWSTFKEISPIFPRDSLCPTTILETTHRNYPLCKRLSRVPTRACESMVLHAILFALQRLHYLMLLPSYRDDSRSSGGLLLGTGRSSRRQMHVKAYSVSRQTMLIVKQPPHSTGYQGAHSIYTGVCLNCA